MGVITDKLTVGNRVFASSVKIASQRADIDNHKTSDIGVLWAADRIAELEAELRKHEWISVDERLPKEDSDVLVWCRDEPWCGTFPANWGSGIFYSSHACYDGELKPEFWKLCAPPEGE